MLLNLKLILHSKPQWLEAAERGKVKTKSGAGALEEQV